jgi:hypothetical protein
MTDKTIAGCAIAFFLVAAVFMGWAGHKNLRAAKDYGKAADTYYNISTALLETVDRYNETVDRYNNLSNYYEATMHNYSEALATTGEGCEEAEKVCQQAKKVCSRLLKE